MKDLSERRILLVDDARPNVDLLVNALKDEYKLSVALDGETALESIGANPPDLVLLDVEMPGLSGYDVCRRIRAEAATQELPVMFLTSRDDVADKMAGFEAGGTDYVTKPFEVLEVKARVRSLLKARAYQEAREEALQRELKIAREIQMSLVTRDFSRWSTGPLDVFALIEPAREVGGDLYSIFPLDDRRVFFVIGDVSGKGIPAALFMATTNALLRTFARQELRPEDVLAKVNAELAAENPSAMFVTLLVGIIDVESGHVDCASGGHSAPVLVRAGQPATFAFDDSGPLVGMDEGSAFPGAVLQLQPGDALVIYTDGVSEAFDPSHALFGDERVVAHLGRGAHGTVREAVEGLLAEVRRFAGPEPQSDDIAIVGVRWRPGRA